MPLLRSLPSKLAACDSTWCGVTVSQPQPLLSKIVAHRLNIAVLDFIGCSFFLIFDLLGFFALDDVGAVLGPKDVPNEAADVANHREQGFDGCDDFHG